MRIQYKVGNSKKKSTLLDYTDADNESTIYKEEQQLTGIISFSYLTGQYYDN